MDTFDKTPHKGKIGIEFPFHNKDEYSKLSTEQKNELYEWRVENGNNKKRKFGNREDSCKAKIAATLMRMNDLEQTVAAIK